MKRHALFVTSSARGSSIVVKVNRGSSDQIGFRGEVQILQIRPERETPRELNRFMAGIRAA